MFSFPEGLFQMSVLSRGGLSMVRYILLAFDVVFVCCLLLLLLFGLGGRRGLFIFLFVCCWLFFVCLFRRNKVKYI